MDSPGSSDGTTQSNGAQSSAGATSDPAATDSGASGAQAGQGNGSAASGGTANAGATTNQSSPNNTNVSVLVDSPGNVGPTNQSNSASSTAGANGGSASGSAQTTQTGATNLNATVRVGSSGDNGTVTQQNNASSGGTGSAASGSAAGSDDTCTAGTTDQELSTCGESDGQNQSDTSQQIDQQQGGAPPDVSENSPLNGGSGNAPAGSTSATTTQTGAANVNVSVRIGSPGSDGTVSQTNSPTANGSSPALSVVNTDGGTNTSVLVNIPGDVTAPGSDWQWNWVWDGSWTPDPTASAGDVAPTSDDVWNWIWSNTEAGTSTSSPSASTDSGGTGSFTWTWDLTLANGTKVSNSWQFACSCNWSWTWSWDWSTPPVSVSTQPANNSSSAPTPQPTQSYDTGAVNQENSTEATAYAGTELQGNQTLDQQADSADDLQVLDSSQIANAVAVASANNVWNRNFSHGVGTGTVNQSNAIEANAQAFDHFDSTQVTVQRQTSSPTTDQSMTSLQWVGNDQSAVADAVASAADSGNANSAWAPSANSAFVGPVLQQNQAKSFAFSGNWGSATQWTQQFQNAGTATTQDEEAYNLLWNIQDGLSVSVASQGDVVNVNDVVVPAGSRATNPSLTQWNLALSEANSVNLATTVQAISQTQNGQADNEVSVAINESWTDQSDVEQSTAYQVNDPHLAGWLGVEPSPSTGGGGGGSGNGGGEGDVILLTGSGGSGGEALSAASSSGGSQHVHVLVGHGHSSAAAAPASAPFGGSTPSSTGPATSGSEPAVTTTSPHSSTGGGSKPSQAPLALVLVAAGAAGSAPGTGGGAVVVLSDPYKLAAPAYLGPRTSASALGPPMVFLDSFESPG